MKRHKEGGGAGGPLGGAQLVGFSVLGSGQLREKGRTTKAPGGKKGNVNEAKGARRTKAKKTVDQRKKRGKKKSF